MTSEPQEDDPILQSGAAATPARRTMIDPAVPRAVLPPISRWKMVTSVVGIAIVISTAVIGLWWAGTRGLTGSDLVTARLEALRVGLSLGVGGGGLFALYLAWRRQRSTEVDLDNRERALVHQLHVAADTKTHQNRVAAATEADAEARRITDLYIKAVEQLGAEKAPVRLGGLYALERLAQDHPGQRQTIVNVMCAYLRMPYSLPGEAPAPNTDKALIEEHQDKIQEREVRLAAQHILTHHLTSGSTFTSTFWGNIDLDLTGAVLIDFRLTYGICRYANFDRVTFSGEARFFSTIFNEDVSFVGATFSELTPFWGAEFRGDADFTAVRFDDKVDFSKATFRKETLFDEVIFTSQATFREVVFDGDVYFYLAIFNAVADFSRAIFKYESGFSEATFNDYPAIFEEATFNNMASFGAVTFNNHAIFQGATFGHEAVFQGAIFNHAVTTFEGATFARGVPTEVEPHRSKRRKEQPVLADSDAEHGA